MTDPRPPWTDSDVDRALTRFFAAECPPDLPRGPTPVARPPLSVRSKRGLLATIAAAVVVAAWLMAIAPPPLHQPVTIAQAPAEVPQELIVTVAEPGPVETFATSAGLMQQHTELKLTTVSWMAPDSGDAIEWQVPELSIEMIPVAATGPGEFR